MRITLDIEVTRSKAPSPFERLVPYLVGLIPSLLAFAGAAAKPASAPDPLGGVPFDACGCPGCERRREARAGLRRAGLRSVVAPSVVYTREVYEGAKEWPEDSPDRVKPGETYDAWLSRMAGVPFGTRA